VHEIHIGYLESGDLIREIEIEGGCSLDADEHLGVVQLVLPALFLGPPRQGRLEHNYFNRFEIWVTKHVIFYQLYSYDSSIRGVAYSAQLSPIICVNIGTLLCFHVLLLGIESDLAKEHAPVGRALLTRKNVLVMATAAHAVSEIQRSLVDLPRISFSLIVGW